MGENPERVEKRYHGVGVSPGIARAVVTKPALLIADEPTGNLDPDLALEIMKLFKRFNDVGVTVVIASHDVHLIDQVGARRIVIGEGRVAAP